MPIPFSDVSTSSLSAAQILTSLESENQNIFDSYDNITYHLKLSYIYKSREIIIAESGKTDVYITDCNIESYIGQDFKIRNASATNFRMEMRESQGTTLFDKLMYIQNNFSFGDYKTAQYRITLTFYGYDQSGNGRINIGGTYAWDVIMNDLTFKVDLFGTIYNLEFSAKQNIAFSDEIGTIKDGGSFTVQDGDTLGSILSQLADFMNKVDLDANFNVQMNHYSFKDEPYSSLNVPIPISIESPFDMVITNNSTVDTETNSSYNDDVTQYSKGIQVTKFIESLISNSPQAASLVTNKAATDETVLTSDNDTSYSITYKIIAKVVYGEFDNTFNKYRKDITYTIVPRVSVNAIQSSRQVVTNNNNFTSWSTKKFKDLYSYGMLTKKYDYIFTGKNTNVFDLNISGNMYYSINLPMLDGARSDSTSVMVGQSQSSEITKNIGMYNTDDAESTDVGLNRYIRQHNINPDDQAISLAPNTNPFNNPLSLTDPNSDQSLIQNAFSGVTYGQLQNQAEQNFLKSEENKRLSISEKLDSMPSVTYIDDVYLSQRNNEFYIPVTFTTQENAFAYSGSVTSNVDNNQLIFSSIMNQVYSLGTDCLQNLSMKIRFDPYWISCGTIAGENRTVDLSYNDRYSTFDIKDICMILEYNIPEYPNDESQITLNRNDMISGVYQVFKVTHTFGNGEMHQTLEANKLVHSNLGTILNFSSGD